MRFIPKLTNISGLQFYQLLRYSVLILIGILLAKSGLDKEAIGNYETFMMITGAFTFFWVQGLMKGLVTMTASENEQRKGVILFNVFLTMFILSIASALVIFFSNHAVSRWLLNGENLPLPSLLALYVVVASPAMMVEYIYLVRNQPGKNVVYGTVIFLLQICLVGVPPMLGYPINYSLYGLMLFAVVRFVWLVVLMWKESVARFDSSVMKELFSLSFPLILSTLLSSSATYIDGFIITAKFSQADFAIFRYGARELPLALLLANSLGVAMVSRFTSTDLRSPLAEMKSEVYRLGVMLFPLSIMLLLISHWAFPVLFNQGFEQSASIFNVYLLLVISRLLFPQTIIMGQRLNKIIVQASLLEIIINVILSLWFAILFGIVGVAYATFVAYAIEKVYLAVAVYRKRGIALKQYLPIMQYISFSSILIVVFIIVEFVLY